MGTTFSYSNIVKFNELSSFTGIEILKGFDHISSLEIELPVGGALHTIGDNCFYMTTLPKNMVFPEGITEFGDHSVSRNYTLEILDLPSTTSSFKRFFAYYCSSLENIIIRSTTPPSVSSYTLPNIPSGVQFFVPDDSLQSYLNDSSWGAYSSRIHPLSEYNP